MRNGPRTILNPLPSPSLCPSPSPSPHPSPSPSPSPSCSLSVSFTRQNNVEVAVPGADVGVAADRHPTGPTEYSGREHRELLPEAPNSTQHRQKRTDRKEMLSGAS